MLRAMNKIIYIIFSYSYFVGLLNNIAEVKHLRQKLMKDLLVKELYILLQSPNIDVSYFAAGIIAHLASDGEECWKISVYTREEMLMELENAISQWKVPESEMVAYRSFKPFFPLLRVDVNYQVQLWAVWAIHHVCTKNCKYYKPVYNNKDNNFIIFVSIRK